MVQVSRQVPIFRAGECVMLLTAAASQPPEQALWRAMDLLDIEDHEELTMHVTAQGVWTASIERIRRAGYKEICWCRKGHEAVTASSVSLCGDEEDTWGHSTTNPSKAGEYRQPGWEYLHRHAEVGGKAFHGSWGKGAHRYSSWGWPEQPWDGLWGASL